MGSRAVFPSPPLPAGEALGLPPQLGGSQSRGQVGRGLRGCGQEVEAGRMPCPPESASLKCQVKSANQEISKTLSSSHVPRSQDSRTESLALYPGMIQIMWSQKCDSLTLCDFVNCSIPGFLVHHHLPEFAQTHVH